MLVGVCGLAGAGKDTSADHLVAKYDFAKLSFADPLKRICRDIYGFSDEQLWGPSQARNAPDKRYLRERFERHDWRHGGNDEWFCDQCGASGDENPPECLVYLTPRFALQQLGTEWGRRCYPATWVDYALRNAALLLDEGTSLRYSTERGIWDDKNAKRGYSHPGVVIPDVRFRNEVEAIRNAGGRIIRVVRPNAGLQGAAALHQSEREQAEIPDSLFDAVVYNDSTISALGEKLDAVVRGWRA